MSNRKILNIGLFGFGCVGQGLYNVLKNSTGIQANIVKIGVKNPNKKRSLDDAIFTYNKDEILDNHEINMIIELINNSKEAFEIVSKALLNGKDVVTANKKMIAEYFNELIDLQKKTGRAVLYEASACGSIPIIRTLEEYYDNETLHSVTGIFNGTSNFILTKLFNEGLDYRIALKQAQDAGFAEIDPTLDVEGYDAKYKLQILTGHSYGIFTKPNQVLNLGISNIKKADLVFAKRLSCKIKLIAFAGKINEQEIALYVAPELVDEHNMLFNVENECNGVIVEAAFSDKQLFIGKGAGGNPTGSAVLSDVSAGSYDYRYEYKKNTQRKYNFTNNYEIQILLSGNNISQDSIPNLEFKRINKNIALVKTTLMDLIIAKDGFKNEDHFVLIVRSQEQVNKILTLQENEFKKENKIAELEKLQNVLI